MADDLRHRYAELVTAWSEPGTRLARLAELLAVRDEELERLRLEAHVGATDSRINLDLRQEITRLRINAEKDVCSGCMQREEARDRAMESARQNGVMYEQVKQRWYEEQDRTEAAKQERDEWRERAEKAELVIARAENLRDKWLAWSPDDMHHAAGLMLAMYLDPRPAALDDQDADRG